MTATNSALSAAGVTEIPMFILAALNTPTLGARAWIEALIGHLVCLALIAVSVDRTRRRMRARHRAGAR